MRAILDKNSKRKLLDKMKEDNACRTLSQLSIKLGIKKKTLESWFYINKTTLPYKIAFPYINLIKIMGKKDDNWGQVLGGKKGYDSILNKYGIEKVKKINSRGGKKTAKINEIKFSKFKIDLEDPKFLEMYGALIGDGWLCNPQKNNKWVVGICGNLKLDKEYILYCRNILTHITERKGYLFEKPKNNVIEFRFQHKRFFKILNEELNFPVGLKENLKIPYQLYSLRYDKLKFIIRGIFDTDGSFYIGKTSKGMRTCPCISLHMKEPVLLKQIADILKKERFSFYFDEPNNQIKLRGKKQLEKWMKEIGFSNPKHLNKINSFLKFSPAC